MNTENKFKKYALAAMMIGHFSTSYKTCPCCMVKRGVNTTSLVKGQKKKKEAGKEGIEEER